MAAIRALEEYQNKLKERFDKRSKLANFQPGDMVLVYSSSLKDSHEAAVSSN